VASPARTRCFAPRAGVRPGQHNYSRWHSRWQGLCQENDGIVPWPPPGRKWAEQEHLSEKDPGAFHGNVRPPTFMSGSKDTPQTVSSWLGGEKQQVEAFSWVAHGFSLSDKGKRRRPGLDSGGTQRPGMMFGNPRRPIAWVTVGDSGSGCKTLRRSTRTALDRGGRPSLCGTAVA